MLVIKIGHPCIQDLIYNLILECMRMTKKLKEKLRYSKKKEANLWEVNYLNKSVRLNLNNPS
jgi:uncharacterized protein YpmB